MSFVGAPLIESSQFFSSTTVNGNLNLFGDITFETGTCSNLRITGEIVNDDDAVTKLYVDNNSGGVPGGSNGDIQFNDNGLFGASSNLSWSTSDILTVSGTVFTTKVTGLAEPVDLTDAANKEYVDNNAGGGTPGGGNGNLQFNENGVFGGTSGLTFINGDTLSLRRKFRFENISGNTNPDRNSSTGIYSNNIGTIPPYGTYTEFIENNYVKAETTVDGSLTFNIYSNINLTLMINFMQGIPYLYVSELVDGSGFYFTLINLDPVNNIVSDLVFNYIIINSYNEINGGE